MEPLETYMRLLKHEKDLTIFTIAQDLHTIRSIMLIIDNKSEVKAIVNSGS